METKYLLCGEEAVRAFEEKTPKDVVKRIKNTGGVLLRYNPLIDSLNLFLDQFDGWEMKLDLTPDQFHSIMAVDINFFSHYAENQPSTDNMVVVDRLELASELAEVAVVKKIAKCENVEYVEKGDENWLKIYMPTGEFTAEAQDLFTDYYTEYLENINKFKFGQEGENDEV